jgi:hypothetical protein
LTVAKQRLADFLREEHRKAESMDNTAAGKLTFGDAAETFKSRLAASKNLKPSSKEYRLERLKALLGSWPNLEKTDIGKIRKHDCPEWAKRFGKDSSATAFNSLEAANAIAEALAIPFANLIAETEAERKTPG